ncbi:MAG: methyltransferase domain-containing protein [Sphingobacteriales bacterium]|nr:MAG: methyltransferase domain-containing protein [Sphingobacteriales bacterium]
MGNANLFYFKHFVIDQSNCAMKIGADSMLLGALANIRNAENILDIGTGSGVLSLMLAQKYSAKIHALEIEENAYKQAVKNASNSCWKNRIEIFHSPLQKFSPSDNIKYDLIISNPPYFQNASHKSKSANQNRAAARDQSLLSFTDLIFFASKWIVESGIFCVIIPFAEKENFIGLARKNNLYLQENIDIRSREESNFIRSILSFSFRENQYAQSKIFTIYKSANKYSEEYLEATEQYHAHDMRKRSL